MCRVLNDIIHIQDQYLLVSPPYIEIFVDCSLEEAEKRDPKGLYKKARAGEIKGFTGIDDPYEAPKNPELHLKTDSSTLEEEIAEILDYLLVKKLLIES